MTGQSRVLDGVGPGSVIAGWTLDRLLGSGGMADIYLARHPRLPRFDVLKLMKPWLAQDPAFRQRFRAEAERMCALTHPNVVTVFDQGEEQGLLYLAMQYVAGGDLRGLLDAEGKLPLPRALRVTEQVADALDAGHALGLVHRDVKPDNVLLAAAAGGTMTEHVFLTDFGVSALDSATRMTRTGQILLSPAYAAPEQFESGRIDGRADQYALACLLYELLTGKPPFSAPSVAVAMKAHLFNPAPQLPRELGQPPELDTVLARALDKQPDQRFASCREFIDSARRASSASPAGSVPRPHAAFPQSRQESQQSPAVATVLRTPEKPAGRNRRPVLIVGVIAVAVAVLAGVGVAATRNGKGTAAQVLPNQLSAAPRTAPPVPAALPLQGAKLTVGSQDFDEQLILGQIAEQVLEHAGATVTDHTGIQGIISTRRALVTGQIDLYADYTGTGWITHLRHTQPIQYEAAQFDAVADEDLQNNRIKWLSPYAPANNTYDLGVRSSAAAALGVHSISDLARLSATNPSALTFCVASEFRSRADGLPGMLQTYGISVPPQNITTMDIGAVYSAVANGSTCNFGEIFATDGRVKSLGLTRLVDDRQFFPNYNPAFTIRQSTFAKYPKVQQVLAPAMQALDTDTLTGLNAQVSVEGESPEQVARNWLTIHGFI